MRIAVVQMSLDQDSRAHNQRQAMDLIARATELDPVPDVVCLPARCDCGVPAGGDPAASEAMTDSFVELLAGKARELGVSLVLGFGEAEGDALYDSAAWIDADGDVLVKHRRICVDQSESDFLSRGNSIHVRQTLFGAVGLAVSQDACAEHLVATMVEMGAGVVIAPCHYTQSSTAHQRMAALAVRNRVHIVAVNSVGPAGGDGHSRIMAPDQGLLCATDSDQEEILCAAIEMED